MVFTRIQETPKDETEKRIHADKPIPTKESIYDIHVGGDKKLLNPLKKGYQMGKKKRKRPQKRIVKKDSMKSLYLLKQSI